MKRISFEIEDTFGNTMMAFEIEVDKKGNVNVLQTQDCSHADTDGDYIFDTDNDLIRIQSDNIIHWSASSNEELKAEMGKRELV